MDVLLFTLLVVVIVYGLCIIIMLGELVQQVSDLNRSDQ